MCVQLCILCMKLINIVRYLEPGLKIYMIMSIRGVHVVTHLEQETINENTQNTGRIDNI